MEPNPTELTEAEKRRARHMDLASVFMSVATNGMLFAMILYLEFRTVRLEAELKSHEMIAVRIKGGDTVFAAHAQSNLWLELSRFSSTNAAFSPTEIGELYSHGPEATIRETKK